jgi:hypothetical protein
VFHHDYSRRDPLPRRPSWILAYATIDVPLEASLEALTAAHPGVPVFGCTSFQGVFSPAGFARGLHLLVGEDGDGVEVHVVFRAGGPGGARAAARAAVAELRAAGRSIDHLLLHATPGFEEALLEGIEEGFEGSPPAVYGGSAADDDLSGAWQIFSNHRTSREGFVLVGFSAKHGAVGSFVSGYTASSTRGVVTSVQGRTIKSIDGKPAASVYNEWTQGAIAEQLQGGVVLSATTLHPLGRTVDKSAAVKRYVLSHPHQVIPGGSLSLFTDVKLGDELVLMLGSQSALVDRTEQAVRRAIGASVVRGSLAGAILIYCAGCVGALGDEVHGVARGFENIVGGAPFVGAATYGEQGSFPMGQQRMNRHGNLMCDTVMFRAH